MGETIILASILSMFHFTGNVPRSFTDAAYEKMEMQRVVEAADRKYVPNELRVYGGNLILVTNIIYEQRILYKFEF